MPPGCPFCTKRKRFYRAHGIPLVTKEERLQRSAEDHLGDVGEARRGRSSRYPPESLRDRYGRRDWKEIASVIRFNFVCPHTVDGPAARGSTSSYVVAGRGSFLPIQGNDGVVTSRTSEADIKKSSRREIGTCLLYTSPSPRDRQKSRMPSSA